MDFSPNGTRGTLKVTSKADRVFSNLKQSALQEECDTEGFVVSNFDLTATILKKKCNNGVSEAVSELAINFKGICGFLGFCGRE